MAELKRISTDAVPAALEKALRYRLLNEPTEAESIACDVLEIEPANQEALITLLLALTDQFDEKFSEALERAKEVLARVAGEYEQAYYDGIIHERWAKAQLVRGLPAEAALGWLREGMRCYEKADAVKTSNDPDALLRWNTCARILQRHEQQKPTTQPATPHFEGGFGDEVPPR